jgi:hypothetical protein
LDSIWTSRNVIDSVLINNSNVERGSNAENAKIYL